MSDETKSGEGSPRAGAAAPGAATPLGPPPRVSLPGARVPTSAGPADSSDGNPDPEDSGSRRPTDPAEVRSEGTRIAATTPIGGFVLPPSTKVSGAADLAGARRSLPTRDETRASGGASDQDDGRARPRADPSEVLGDGLDGSVAESHPFDDGDLSIDFSVGRGPALTRRKARAKPTGRTIADALGINLNLPPSSPRVRTAGQSAKFVEEEDIPDEDIQGSDVILRKEHYGVPGTKEYRKNAVLATTPLAEKFGVACHRVISRSSGPQIGDEAKSRDIQEQVVGVIHRVKEGKQHAIAMDMMAVCLLPQLITSAVLAGLPCPQWWDETETNIFDEWDKLTLQQVKLWQYCVNKRFSLADRIASSWLKVFIYKSSTDSLRAAVAKKYDKIHCT